MLSVGKLPKNLLRMISRDGGGFLDTRPKTTLGASNRLIVNGPPCIVTVIVLTPGKDPARVPLFVLSPQEAFFVQKVLNNHLTKRRLSLLPENLWEDLVPPGESREEWVEKVKQVIACVHHLICVNDIEGEGFLSVGSLVSVDLVDSASASMFTTPVDFGRGTLDYRVRDLTNSPEQVCSLMWAIIHGIMNTNQDATVMSVHGILYMVAIQSLATSTGVPVGEDRAEGASFYAHMDRVGLGFMESMRDKDAFESKKGGLANVGRSIPLAGCVSSDTLCISLIWNLLGTGISRALSGSPKSLREAGKDPDMEDETLVSEVLANPQTRRGLQFLFASTGIAIFLKCILSPSRRVDKKDPVWTTSVLLGRLKLDTQMDDLTGDYEAGYGPFGLDSRSKTLVDEFRATPLGSSVGGFIGRVRKFSVQDAISVWDEFVAVPLNVPGGAKGLASLLRGGLVWGHLLVRHLETPRLGNALALGSIGGSSGGGGRGSSGSKKPPEKKESRFTWKTPDEVDEQRAQAEEGRQEAERVAKAEEAHTQARLEEQRKSVIESLGSYNRLQRLIAIIQHCQISQSVTTAQRKASQHLDEVVKRLGLGEKYQYPMFGMYPTWHIIEDPKQAYGIPIHAFCCGDADGCGGIAMHGASKQLGEIEDLYQETCRALEASAHIGGGRKPNKIPPKPRIRLSLFDRRIAIGYPTCVSHLRHPEYMRNSMFQTKKDIVNHGVSMEHFLGDTFSDTDSYWRVVAGLTHIAGNLDVTNLVLENDPDVLLEKVLVYFWGEGAREAEHDCRGEMLAGIQMLRLSAIVVLASQFLRCRFDPNAFAGTLERALDGSKRVTHVTFPELSYNPCFVVFSNAPRTAVLTFFRYAFTALANLRFSFASSELPRAREQWNSINSHYDIDVPLPTVGGAVSGTNVDEIQNGRYPEYWQSIVAGERNRDPDVTKHTYHWTLKLHPGHPSPDPDHPAEFSYNDIEAMIRKTVPRIRILSIERIIRLDAWDSAVAVYRGVRNKRGKDHTNVEMLFHGCSSDVVGVIADTQLDRSATFGGGKNAQAYGYGVYLAKNASYSANRAYSTPDRDGTQHMLVCWTATGVTKYTQSNTTILPLDCDSGGNRSDIFVAFRDHQACPCYVVRFKQ
jgi:hypothetical protein